MCKQPSGSGFESLSGSHREEVMEVMTEVMELKRLFAYEKNISYLQTEMGMSPRAEVEGIMPSGLVNLNTWVSGQLPIKLISGAYKVNS